MRYTVYEEALSKQKENRHQASHLFSVVQTVKIQFGSKLPQNQNLKTNKTDTGRIQTKVLTALPFWFL